MDLDFIVDEEYENIRIDKYLSEMLPEHSRNYFQTLIGEDKVLVDGKKCKASYKMAPGEKVSVSIPDALGIDILPENIPLDILYEDDDVIVVNKPKGMVVHPAPGHYTGTMVNALMYHCGDSLSGINGVLRPGIVHRIDKDTTGVLVACKNDFSHNNISLQLKNHSITRKYVGIVNGCLKNDEEIIDAPIGRHPVRRKEMAVNVKNGKNAVTCYKVLERYTKYTYAQFQLETGRTHQIRVHMAYIGHPLLGDEVYGHVKSPYKLQGQCLHAMVLGFIHPRTGEYMEYEAPVPDYMKDLLKIIR